MQAYNTNSKNKLIQVNVYCVIGVVTLYKKHKVHNACLTGIGEIMNPGNKYVLVNTYTQVKQ